VEVNPRSDYLGGQIWLWRLVYDRGQKTLRYGCLEVEDDYLEQSHRKDSASSENKTFSVLVVIESQ
jgi:hypothetical protein